LNFSAGKRLGQKKGIHGGRGETISRSTTNRDDIGRGTKKLKKSDVKSGKTKVS